MTAQHSDVVNEKKRLSPSLAPYSPVSERAPAVARVLRLAEKKGVDLTRQLNDTVGPAGWSEWLARDILTILEATLREGREKMGPAMRQAYDNALRAAESDFWELVQQAKDHPLETAAAVLITIIAIGVLVELAPFLLEWLGFARAGPVAGEIFCKQKTGHLADLDYVM